MADARPVAEQKIIGLFSVGRNGKCCLHEGEATKEEAERIRKLLNKSVTGGPYKMFAAIAAPIDGVEVWRDPDTGRTTPKIQPCSVEEARAALGVGASGFGTIGDDTPTVPGEGA